LSTDDMSRKETFQNRLRNVLSILSATIVLLFFGCLDQKFYQANHIIYEAPDNYNLQYEEILFSSKDGTKLYGWFIPAIGDAIGTIIYFHGNYGNSTYYFKQIYWLPSHGFNLFTFDYRGYGRSGGTPDRVGIYEDCVAAIEYIISRHDIDNSKIFVFAQSLGGANAITAIANNDFLGIRAIALEGTFYSYRTEAQDIMISSVRKNVGGIPCLSMQIWPVSFFAVSDCYSPGKVIDQLPPVPLLLIHCASDSIVPYHHCERLYKQAKEPKQMWTIKECNHLDVFTHKQYDHKYRQKLVDFFVITQRISCFYFSLYCKIGQLAVKQQIQCVA